jgi:hypothetical protein
VARSQRRTALFYDAPLATREDVALLKAMLLFFDDIAVFSAPAHRSRPPAVDPYLIAALADRGLLRFVNPRAVMTSQTEVIICSTLHRAAMEKADHWLAAAAAGDWDLEVPRLQGRVASAAPPPGDKGSVDLYKFLAQDGWLFPEEPSDEDWVVAPGIASVANSILAQVVRATAGGQDWLIEPVATRRDEARVFTAIFDGAIENVSAAQVVMSDLSAVTLDLSGVGLDDILDFRHRHRSELSAYVRSLHAIRVSDPTSQAMADRRAALADQAERLRELQLRRWTKVGSTVSLGMIGASWTLGSGDLLGALIGGTAAGPQLLPDRPTPVAAYTYIVRPDIECAD